MMKAIATLTGVAGCSAVWCQREGMRRAKFWALGRWALDGSSAAPCGEAANEAARRWGGGIGVGG